MTNENNKINELVSSPDDDPTSEFQIPDLPKGNADRNPTQSEVDEKTFDVDKFASGDESAIDTVSTLNSTLKEQAETIGQLQFELEQLSGRANGLEREVRAREEITANISREFKQVKQQLKDTDSELQDRHHEIEFLQHAFRESNEAVARLSADAERLRQESIQEIEYYRNQAAEQTGLIASNAQELRELTDQIERTEKYADSLRIKLQSQTYSTNNSSNKRRELELSLKNKQAELEALNDQLANEQQKNDQLASENEQLKDDFARELRQVRFELGTAQETISCQGSLNEQLASDLIDNQGFRQALESQLGEIEEKNQQTAQKLTRRLRKAQKEADGFERKMRAKDKAIAALMSELANHSETEKQPQGAEQVMRKVDGYKPTRREQHDQQARARVARLLIGDTDGRELRFPLFKDRLTIGRTANNDIQLNVRYISRRHAVIVTDNGQTRVVDWGSKNGVYVNQKRVAERFLKSGDVVTIGTTKFRYEERPKR